MLTVTLLVLLASPDSALTEARDQEQAGHDDKAIAALDAAVRRDPTFALAQLELGRLLLKSGADAQKAATHLDVARALTPENPRAHYFYAMAVDEQGRHEEAIRSYEVALKLREDFSDAQSRLGGLLYAAGDYPKAAAAYRRHAELHPEDTGARLQLAAALARSGSEKEAEKVLRGLAEKPASRLVATRRLADLIEQQGRKAEAHALRDSVDGPKKQLRPLGPSHR